MHRIPLATMNHHYLFYDLERFFSAAHELGYPCVELWTAPQHFFMDYRQNEPIEKIERLARTYDVRVMGICPEQTNPKPNNMAAREEAAQERTYAYFTRAVDVASAVGASQVLVTSGWAFYDEPLEDARARSAAMLRRIASYAEGHGINLAIEALRRPESLIANSVADLKLMLDMVGSPALKVCLDIGAMVDAGDTIQGYFDAFGPDVIHAHFVDCGTRSLHLALGDGERDVAADIATFARNGYRGVLSVECTDAQTHTDPVGADARSMRTYLDAYSRIEEAAPAL